jgi:hypothetical protein
LDYTHIPSIFRCALPQLSSFPYTDIPIVQATYPGVNPPNSTIQMINQFLDWAQEQGFVCPTNVYA